MPRFILSSRSRVARSAASLALVTMIAALAACGSDKKTTTGPSDVSGTYTLVSVDGSPLPYAVPNNPEHAIVIQSADLTLVSDHSYTVTGTGTSDGGDPEQVLADQGTYSTASGSGSASGTAVTFTSTAHSGAIYTATATSTTLSATAPGAFAGSTNTSFTFGFNKDP